MAKISILGGGSWGIGLAVLLHKNGHQVTVWSAVPQEIAYLKEHHEHKMLPGVKLPEDIVYTTEDARGVEGMDLLVMAVASAYTRVTAKRLAPLVAEGQMIVNVAKGIEDGTYMTLSEIIEQEIPQAQVAVLSGPSHAEEVSRGLPTSIVVGAHSRKVAETLQNYFMSDVFRVYTSADVLGIELGGSLKNVVALAAGIADGLGYGDNTKAALITRGIHEIARLGMAMGGKPETFYGLTGIGDLIVTCASMHSRNRRCGILIGQGTAPDEAVEKIGMVVEGITTAEAAAKLARKYHVEMPITKCINACVHGELTAKEAVDELMTRDRKNEMNFR